uniref:DNA-directed DNA polymerase n=1 Tax=Echinostoma caproni TaxID=27848 RepID=A0A183APH8_9TREM
LRSCFQLNCRHLCKPAYTPDFRGSVEEPVFNEVKIQMFSRELQSALFGSVISEYGPPPRAVSAELEAHGIKLQQPHSTRPPIRFPLPQLHGADIKEHVYHVAEEMIQPYIHLLSSFPSQPPPFPDHWSTSPGWTRYFHGHSCPVNVPSEDVLFFDTEVILAEGNAPTMAVALSPIAWYSWVSPTLSPAACDPKPPEALIRLSTDLNRIKCVIGHFVSFDRARIEEEYLPHVMPSFNHVICPQFPSINIGYKDAICGHTGVTCGRIGAHEFPHPATLYGLLEMGSMYLPVSDAWTEFQNRADQAFEDNERRQRSLLMQLANQALERYNRPDAEYKTEAEKKLAKLPKWYRELIPKPIKENVDAGPCLLTAQMRIAPKLLRLCWQGLPIHFDQELKWGILIPGRAPQPYGDPRYFEDTPSEPMVEDGKTTEPTAQFKMLTHQVRALIPVRKRSAAGETELLFPYRVYLDYWLAEMKRKLLNLTGTPDKLGVDSTLGSAYAQRAVPDSRDDQLMHELQRSIEAMPLEYADRVRLITTIAAIRDVGAKSASKEMENRRLAWGSPRGTARGPAFWSDAKRYERTESVVADKKARSRRRAGGTHAMAVDTVNPNIPCCWFCHLPHESAIEKIKRNVNIWRYLSSFRIDEMDVGELSIQPSSPVMVFPLALRCHEPFKAMSPQTVCTVPSYFPIPPTHLQAIGPNQSVWLRNFFVIVFTPPSGKVIQKE